MDLFKKKVTAAQLGEYLANTVAMNVHIPDHENPFLKFLIEVTPLDEVSARFELICLMAVIFDNTVLANISSISQRKDLLNSFYYSLKDILGEWTGDADKTEKILISRIQKYYEALETGQLASGTPAIARAFLDVCEAEKEGSIEDYIEFIAQTMILLTASTELAQKTIKQYKLV